MIHPTAEVSPSAKIGEGTKVWHHAQIREGAQIGKRCIVGKSVYVDSNVVIGNDVKIQNRASVYHGVTVEDGVFIGPHVCFTNDLFPRAVNVDGRLKSDADWEVAATRVCYGASLGAGAVIVAGVTIGTWALVGAGAVVTRDVPPHALVVGNPAHRIGYVCKCGRRLQPKEGQKGMWTCEKDGLEYCEQAEGGLRAN